MITVKDSRNKLTASIDGAKAGTWAYKVTKGRLIGGQMTVTSQEQGVAWALLDGALAKGHEIDVPEITSAVIAHGLTRLGGFTVTETDNGWAAVWSGAWTPADMRFQLRFTRRVA